MDKSTTFFVLCSWVLLVVVAYIVTISKSPNMNSMTLYAFTNETRNKLLSSILSFKLQDSFHLNEQKDDMHKEFLNTSSHFPTPNYYQTPFDDSHHNSTNSPMSNFRELFKSRYNLQFPVHFSDDNIENKGDYFIYRCDEGRMRSCGGWADRIKGMMTAYVLANLTGRTFKAEMKTHGCNFLDYLVPNKVNWRLPRSFHEHIKQDRNVQILNAVDNLRFYNGVDNMNFARHPAMEAKFVYFKSNLDHFDKFKESIYHSSQLSWMKNLTRDQISSAIFRHLFKLSPQLQKQMDTILMTSFSSSSEKLVCAHIRMGRNPSIPKDSVIRNTADAFPNVWKFIKEASSQLDHFKVFVMSDSQDAIEDAKKQSFSDKLILIPGGIAHVERDKEAANEEVCKGQVKLVLEQFLLMSCDVLMISLSGLSRMAAYVRGSDVGLHCLAKGEVCHFGKGMGRGIACIPIKDQDSGKFTNYNINSASFVNQPEASFVDTNMDSAESCGKSKA